MDLIGFVPMHMYTICPATRRFATTMRLITTKGRPLLSRIEGLGYCATKITSNRHVRPSKREFLYEKCRGARSSFRINVQKYLIRTPAAAPKRQLSILARLFDPQKSIATSLAKIRGLRKSRTMRGRGKAFETHSTSEVPNKRHANACQLTSLSLFTQRCHIRGHERGFWTIPLLEVILTQ